MNTQLGHLQINVHAANVPFYKDLFAFLEWKTIVEMEGMLGVIDHNHTSLWFVGQAKEVQNDYDGPGVNHIAISVAAQADIDTAATYLREQGVQLLFDTPKHRPDFAQGPDQTYYQVMLESPDRILLEIVYTGVKSI